MNIVRECIAVRRFTILQGERRQKNVRFIRQHNIRYNEQVEIINNLKVDDFCHSLVSTNEHYLGSLLYVFAPNVEFFNINCQMETVCMYIKIQICELRNGKKTVAVSFHELERPIEYAFK